MWKSVTKKNAENQSNAFPLGMAKKIHLDHQQAAIQGAPAGQCNQEVVRYTACIVATGLNRGGRTKTSSIITFTVVLVSNLKAFVCPFSKYTLRTFGIQRREFPCGTKETALINPGTSGLLAPGCSAWRSASWYKSHKNRMVGVERNV